VHGRVQAVRTERIAGRPSLECTLVDDTGGVSIVLFGRRRIEGVEIGSTLTATGMAIEQKDRLGIVNPIYELSYTRNERTVSQIRPVVTHRVTSPGPRPTVRSFATSTRRRTIANEPVDGSDIERASDRQRLPECSGRRKAAGGPTSRRPEPPHRRRAPRAGVAEVAHSLAGIAAVSSWSAEVPHRGNDGARSGGNNTFGLSTLFGSSAALIARYALISAGVRTSDSHARLALPMPCSALIEP